jgi:hypothetical protein
MRNQTSKLLLSMSCILFFVLPGCVTSPALDFVDPFFMQDTGKVPDCQPKTAESKTVESAAEPKACTYDWFQVLAYKLKREGIDMLKQEYEKVREEGKKDKAQLLRNRIIYRGIGLIDEYQENYKNQVRVSQSIWGTLFDYLQLGVTAATSVVGGEGVKAILGATATGLKGGQLSISQNWFAEKTSMAIASQMDALRNKKKLEIVKKVNDDSYDDNKYPLESALNDLRDYFYSGSMINALSSLAEEAAAKSSDSRKQLSEETTP